MAKVTAIIVNYNTGKLLTEAVNSVINFKGIEVIVVDNDSRDESISLLRSSIKSTNLRIFENESNLGFSKAINQGVSKATGDYVYLLNPDAKLTDQALSRMITTAEKHGDRAIVAPRLENPDGTAQASCYRPQTIWRAIQEFWLKKKGSYSKYLPKGKSPRKVFAAAAAAWLVPRKIWQELGGLNEEYFLYFEDLDMCARAHRLGIDVIYDPQAVVKHHHGVSASTNPIVMKLFTKSAYKYHGLVKKITIDLIIRSARIFELPLTLRKISAIYILWLLLISGFTVLGYFIISSRMAPLDFIKEYWQSNYLFWSWANFDGEHYLSIAKYGYQIRDNFPQYAFFPLYPLLIKLLSLFTGDLLFSGKILSLGASFVFIVYFVKWMTLIKVKKITRILLTTLLFPSAVFLQSIYTESLFIMLAVLTFYLAEQKNWGKASLMAALATATRVNGIFLALFLILKMSKSKLRPKKIIQYALLSISGLLAYMAYLWRLVGDPLAFYNAQRAWGKSDPTSPLTTISTYWKAVTSEFVLDLTHVVVVLEVLALFWGTYLLYRAILNKKLSASYSIYIAGNLALPLLTGSLGSMPRFLILIFPAFVIIESFTRRKTAILYAMYTFLLLLGTILFTRGYWYA